jgi:hypothetical protein
MGLRGRCAPQALALALREALAEARPGIDHEQNGKAADFPGACVSGPAGPDGGGG